MKVTGYSQKNEEYNPAMKDFVNAFRGYKPKSRMKRMKPKLLDYIAFMFIATGILSIIAGIFIISLFIAGWIFIIIGVALSFISSGLNDMH
ncbi:MAG: hypothetical protein J7K61_05265 [Thermoplasmata archaeon]|nr:hypothetical protein [Thermoplasmata archaeon]